ncbi:hypothetical protein R6Q59_004146 [Mikania micrantha]
MSEARKKSLISVTPPAKSMPFADDRKTNASPPSISTTSGSRKVVIKSADMKEEMQSEAVNIAISVAFEDLSVEKDVAEQIKKEFDKNHGPTWHCIVGKNFGMAKHESSGLHNKSELPKIMAGTSRAGGSQRPGRSPTPPGSPGSDQDIADILDSHPFLQFPLRTDAHRRLGRLITRPIEVPRAIDWDVLRLLGKYQRVVTIIGVDTPWRRFFDGGFLSAYREITYEFFCTFRFLHPQTSGPCQHPGPVWDFI